MKARGCVLTLAAIGVVVFGLILAGQPVGRGSVRTASVADPLASLIVRSGDLPEAYQTYSASMPWRIYPGIPETSQAYYYEIADADDVRAELGHIVVVRYGSVSDAGTAYAAIRKAAEQDKSVEPLTFAERGSRSGPARGSDTSNVLFQQCKTIVHVALTGQTLDAITSYAQQLHRRLAPAIC
jgi:hypothetical protein